jgi:hypothetical protein
VSTRRWSAKATAKSKGNDDSSVAAARGIVKVCYCLLCERESRFIFAKNNLKQDLKVNFKKK